MSWYCQMVDTERRCMDWGYYIKDGWDESKSFLVEEYQGSYFKPEELKERLYEKDL